jgi:hypothetical protein
LTGTCFDEAVLSGALMANATFTGYTAPARKAAAGQGSQLGRAVAKAVGKGVGAEFRGGDSEDAGGGSQEDVIVEEGQSMIDVDDLAYALDQVRKVLGISSCRRFKHFATIGINCVTSGGTPRKPSVPGRGDGGRRAGAVGAGSGGALARVRQGRRTNWCEHQRLGLGLIQLVQ